MAQRKSRIQHSVRGAMPASFPHHDPGSYIPGPKLREMLGISAVTLWRWRQDEKAGFPRPTKINDRLYFPRAQVLAWIERQPKTA
jgi:predicted DNA-binding transcriptional regulator AlpA